ncbi:MAG: hypothetical protein QNJ40_08615 [Xanthomonadales bacterium]|nr:hypothetical protein [Xanthomonadales bacterium]
MEQEHWGWRRRSIAEVLWPSFLAAAVGTMVFFALIDPDLLLMAAERQADWSQTAIYSVGFFSFWALTALSSGLTTWLIRTERRKAEFPRDRRRPPESDEQQEQG